MTNYIDKGRSLLQQKEYTKALEFFQAAIESEKSPKDAYLGLAEVYFALQKDKQGREALFNALALDPYNERGLMMAQQYCFAKETFIETKDVPSSNQIARPSIGVSSNTKFSLIPPNINRTPYHAVEFSDGNMIFLEKNSKGYTIVAPNRQDYLGNNWDGYKKPQGTIVIPKSVCIDGKSLPIVKIGESAFSLCKINNIIIPDSIEVISRSAFSHNDLLKEVSIPNSVQFIRVSAFSHCRNLEKIQLPEILEVIDEKVFEGAKITSIDIPASVITIYFDAFGTNAYGKFGLLPQKMILHGPPPKLKEGFHCTRIYIRDSTEAYVPAIYLQDYKFAQYWQEMKLIPY